MALMHVDCPEHREWKWWWKEVVWAALEAWLRARRRRHLGEASVNNDIKRRGSVSGVIGGVIRGIEDIIH
jgi:hypothetical protein